MTAPGGSYGESGHDDHAPSVPAGDRAPEPPPWQPPWDAPAAPPAIDYPPYGPPNYPPAQPPGYPPDYSAGYPPPLPPTGYAQPGYQQPSGYGGAPYPPMPAPFGAPPGGYGPPSYPPYPAGYHPGPDYLGGYGAMQSGTNTMAVVSLVSSLVGLLCCIGSVVAIVLGAMALNEIKRTREDGHGLAVAGIVIGVATLVVYLVIIIFSAHSR
jgi:Domain of unknown function (DUF4190)